MLAACLLTLTSLAVKLPTELGHLILGCKFVATISDCELQPLRPRLPFYTVYN